MVQTSTRLPLTMENFSHSLVQFLAPVHVCQLYNCLLIGQDHLTQQLGQWLQCLLGVCHIRAKHPVIILVKNLRGLCMAIGPEGLG